MQRPATIQSEAILFEGRLFELLEQRVKVEHAGSFVEQRREVCRRTPGVRVVIAAGATLVLIREFRVEHDSWDLRLPGGKVFDSLEKYRRSRKEGSLLEAARQAAFREVREETGFRLSALSLLGLSRCGASVDWDLFFFHGVAESGPTEAAALELGEFIEVRLLSRQEVWQACIDGRVREDRTLGVLMRFLKGGYS